MKKVLLNFTLLIVLLYASAGISQAQFFPPTGYSARCNNCVPHPNYTIVSGASGVSVSDSVYYAASAIKWKSTNGSDVITERPPSSRSGDAPNHWSGTFLSLLSGPNIDSKVKFTVGNFIPGQKYKLHYAVMATRTLSSTFGTEAVLEIETPNNPNNLFGAIVDLTQAKNQWKEMVAEFTATEESLVFILSGNTSIGTGIVNFDIETKPLDCILPVGQQVQLYSSKPVVMYPCETVNLDLLVKLPWPVGADVVWKFVPYSSGVSIENVQHASPGAEPFYAFYYHKANGCYTLAGNNKSTAEVNVSYVPQQVPLNAGTNVAVQCPQSKYKLKSKLSLPSDSTRVKWFNNNSHQGLSLEKGEVTAPGTYYAFFYSDQYGCYSTDISTSSVTVSFETPCCNATGQVLVSNMGTPISINCPSTSIKGWAFLNYTNVVANNPNLPAGVEIVWYDNAKHQGSQIDVSPNANIGPGTYYAFFKDVINNCFAVDQGLGVSTRYAQVVLSGNCGSGPKLSLRTALQGAIQTAPSDHIMRNDLQTYLGNSGILPTTNPYGGSESCQSINNVATIGAVVDWVRVEIRDATNPAALLEAKNLLLSTSGFVLNLDGSSEPVFSSQSKPVRIVVKHRNHLAVMSNPIQNFSSGTISYDFTTALSNASNEFGAPDPLVQKNGIWCMRLGDLNVIQDFGVDGVDGAYFNAQFKTGVYDVYDRADLDMDGFVDGVDGSLFNINFYSGIYSTLINY